MASLPPENVFGHRKKLDFLRAHIIDCLSRHPGRQIRLLDIGCSNGQYVTRHLGELGVRILAIDPHEPSIQYAIERNPYPETTTYRVGTLDVLSVDERFDVVVMSDVLEHIPDPGSLLDEARNRLVDGGIILVSIPNGFGPFEIESALDRSGCLAPSYWLFAVLSRLKGLLTGRKNDGGSSPTPYAGDCRHVRFWTLKSFRKLVQSHGLRITHRRNGPWLGALCTSTWWGRSLSFCRWNSGMGNVLPSWMVSAWYFKIEAVES